MSDSQNKISIQALRTESGILLAADIPGRRPRRKPVSDNDLSAHIDDMKISSTRTNETVTDNQQGTAGSSIYSAIPVLLVVAFLIFSFLQH